MGAGPELAAITHDGHDRVYAMPLR